MKDKFFVQQSHWDCAISCLAMLHYHFYQISTIHQQLFFTSQYYQNLNLLQLEKLAKQCGLNINSFRTDWTSFCILLINKPIILPIIKEEVDHYIIVMKQEKQQYLVGDPTEKSWQWWSETKLKKVFQNIIIYSQGLINCSIYQKITKNKYFFNQNLKQIYWIGTISALISTLLLLAQQFFLKILIEKIVMLEKSETFVISLTIATVLLFGTRIIIELITEYQINFWQFWYQKQQMQRFWQHLKSQQLRFFYKQNAEIIWQKYHYFQIILDHQITAWFIKIKSVLIIVSSLAMLLIIDLWLLIPVLCLIIINLLLNLLFWPYQQQINKEHFRKEQNVHQQFLSHLHNWIDWKQRQLVPRAIRQTQLINQQLFWSHKHIRWLTILNNFSYKNILFWSQIGILFLLTYTSNSTIKISNLLFVLALSMNIFEQVQILFDCWCDNKKITWLKKQTLPFFQFNQPHTNPKLNTTAINKLNIVWRVKLKKLNFSYNDLDNLWKKSLNLELKNHLLLLGKSGVGKTTLLQLFSENSANYSGEINFNANFLKNQTITPTEILYIKSNSQLFTITIKTNVFIYQTVKLNLRLKNWMEQILKDLHLNWNSNVKAQPISSGQRQIIIFLSLFTAKVPVFLLDECLNSVDQELKIILLKKLLDYKQNTIIIYASHDQNLIKLFPQIINLSNYVPLN